MSRAPATILLRPSLTCVGLVGSRWVSLALVGLRLPTLARVGRSGLRWPWLAVVDYVVMAVVIFS